MFSRISSRAGRVARRFQSHAAQAEAKPAPFNNKYNFNINPPPVHAYWNARNFSVLIAFVPVFLGAGYLGKYAGENAGGFEALLDFADSEQSPMKELKFGEAQKK
ncbi:hypothetical protein METBIDRAFT_47154 [Metschnikowia bicuspidata var. bicuspidata NRRL YB-4993]|uniref:Uncharacterized protein n=1 Tax=Metschnikowia bicuspidata var. bicuspidata NRRL YB-4993 TaxID=869754 RepID=A0A1A0H520_9ASCO|nr:hypothetical protein METBIDRAFT_47154 [Metschnikowia bicuspidata var. bicuspidata NRRL YB-4993]OBA19007.1 hypothetical protein METBIDRAFT_47154 [Metschnikowia bicuspidata var. bicuspidata NRRL YB-4993]